MTSSGALTSVVSLPDPRREVTRRAAVVESCGPSRLGAIQPARGWRACAERSSKLLGLALS